MSAEAEVQEKALEDMTVEELEAKLEENSHEDVDISEVESQAMKAQVSDEQVHPEKSANADEIESEPTLAEVTKELKNMQKLLARQGTELGSYRKLEEKIQSLAASKQQSQLADDEIDPADMYDPKKVAGIIDARVQRALSDKSNNDSARTKAAQSQKAFINKRVPDFDSVVDGIAEMTKSLIGDDVPDVDDIIAKFKANPYSEDPMSLLFAAQAVKAQRELAELKKKMEGRTESLADKVKRATRSKPLVGAGSGQAKASGTLDISDRALEGMSLQDLEELHSQLISQEE